VQICCAFFLSASTTVNSLIRPLSLTQNSMPPDVSMTSALPHPIFCLPIASMGIVHTG
jgi:hypothetical protein